MLHEDAKTVHPSPLTRLGRKQSFVKKSATAKAPHLHPVTMEPERFSIATIPLAYLRTIERIEINHMRVHDGVTYYVLDVRATLLGLCYLRQFVYELVCRNPQYQCEHYNKFIMHVRFHLHQPRGLAKLFTSTDTRKTILAAFLNDFLRMALRKEKQNRKCVSEDHVPHLLEAFVRDPDVLESSTATPRFSWL